MDVSRVTDKLFIASYPKAEYAEAIRDLNVRLILNMIFIRPAEIFNRPPFHMLTLRTFDSIFIPIPIGKLKKGVESALPVLQAGDSVLIYCRRGRHRSVAMASAVLIGQGYSADRAMQLIKSKREKADPYTWHIQRRIRKFEEVWHKIKPNTF